MKKSLVIITLSLFFIGCHMNPNKEARIQKLETEIQQFVKKINQLERRIETLEEINAGLKSKIKETKNH